MHTLCTLFWKFYCGIHVLIQPHLVQDLARQDLCYRLYNTILNGVDEKTLSAAEELVLSLHIIFVYIFPLIM